MSATRLTRPDAVDDPPERLHGAHPGLLVAGLDGDVVAHGDRAVGQRAGDDRAAALGGEHAVDPQSRPAAITGGRGQPGEVGERGGQLVDAGSRRRGDGHDRRPAEERPGEVVGDLHRRQFDELGVVEQVDLGEGDDAVGDADELEDAQVLLALRLPALGGGDDEQAGVDAADAGEHVAQEAHVARDVDEADRLAVDDAVGEAEVDRQPAALLLLEAVGVGPRQQADERRLAVVDVTGGSDHAHTDTMADDDHRY